MKKNIILIFLFLIFSLPAICAEKPQNLCDAIELTPSGTVKVLGNPIDCGGLKSVGLMLSVDGYNATGIQVKTRAQRTSGGDDYKMVQKTGTGEIITLDDEHIYELSGTLTQNTFFKIDVEGVPYLEISANATVSEPVTGTGAIIRCDYMPLQQ